MTAPIRLSERRGGALTMLDALTLWHEQDEDARPLTGPLAECFIAGFRGDETPPLVRAFLDGERARLLGDLSDTPAPAAAAPLAGHYDGAGM